MKKKRSSVKMSLIKCNEKEKFNHLLSLDGGHPSGKANELIASKIYNEFKNSD